LLESEENNQAPPTASPLRCCTRREPQPIGPRSDPNRACKAFRAQPPQDLDTGTRILRSQTRRPPSQLESALLMLGRGRNHRCWAAAATAGSAHRQANSRSPAQIGPGRACATNARPGQEPLPEPSPHTPCSAPPPLIHLVVLLTPEPPPSLPHRDNDNPTPPRSSAIQPGGRRHRRQRPQKWQCGELSS
jgi:hypothetical protein